MVRSRMIALCHAGEALRFAPSGEQAGRSLLPPRKTTWSTYPSFFPDFFKKTDPVLQGFSRETVRALRFDGHNRCPGIGQDLP